MKGKGGKETMKCYFAANPLQSRIMCMGEELIFKTAIQWSILNPGSMMSDNHLCGNK